MYYKKQEYFNSKIAEYKEKSENEILDYLSNFWHVSPHADGVIRLYASYQKSDHKDSKGNDFAFFIDVRNEAGDILYYPYNLGKVKIWSQYKASFESQPIWQINVRLSEKKFRKANPFELSLANNIVGKPSLKFNDRLDKESYIKKLFHDTGSTEKDAKTIVNALHNIMDDLYTDADERFVYELIQNADDQPRDGKNVSVNMQLLNRHLLFMHNGRPFDKDDIYSICDIGSSTKRNSKEKIGYKGIGFKSVFTGSDTVIVNSENYSFAFDKYSPIYTGMNIENIPWQLKPIWQEKYRYPQEVRTNEYFWKSPVGISLEIDEGDVKYDNSIRKILSNPLFLLFLKNVDSVHYQHDYNDFVVSKKTEDNIVHITQNDEIISSWATFDFVVDIPSDIREAMQNDRNVPQKMKEATKTQISFAAKIKDSQIEQISNSVLYAYLPTPVNDFQFNFIVNADFLLTANREQLHTKKIWNQFLFQKIGELLIEWSKTLSKNSTSYLSVIPQIELVEEETGHLALSSYFNSAYKSAIESEAFILNHKGELAKQEEIIIDKTGLSEIVGADIFCHLLQTEKCLPSEKIDSKILEKDIFEEIELMKFDDVIDAITNNEDFNEWFVSATDEQKQTLYKWIEDKFKTSEDKLKSFVSNLPLFQFGEDYKSCEEIKALGYIVITDVNVSAKNIFSKLGFVCSDEVFDKNHPLYKFIEKQDEKKLFETIKKSDFSILDVEESLSLFKVLKDVKGIEENQLKELASNLPLFKYNGEIKSQTAISGLNNYLITTEHTIAIKNILQKLGFICSDNVFDDKHPLYGFIELQSSNALFNSIKDCDFLLLTADERRTLFFSLADFDGVGDAKLKKEIALFKNMNGKFKPLGEMAFYDNDCPIWLNDYVIANEEYSSDLDKYLISNELVFQEIVQTHYSDFEYNSVLELYNQFNSLWTSAFTKSLIDKYGASDDLLTIVERTDGAKHYFIEKYGRINLDNTTTADSIEYRLIRLALSCNYDVNKLKRLIYIDNRNITEFTVAPDVSITLDKEYLFPISEILPNQSENYSVFNQIKDLLSDINGSDALFSLTRMKNSDVRNQLKELSTPAQYAFYVCYNIANSYRYTIPITDEQFITNVLDYFFDKNIDVLGRYIQYFSNQKIIGCFINSDDYTLESERLSNIIRQWANDEEKERFLIALGVKGNLSDEIKRRKAFVNNEPISLPYSNDIKTEIRSFLDWCITLQTPFIKDNQVTILKEMFSRLNIQSGFHDEDFSEIKEWDNKRYIEFVRNKLVIYCMEQEMPKRGVYNNVHLFTEYVGDYYLSSNRLYVNVKDKNIETVLMSVCDDGNIPLFTKNDWTKLFMVSVEALNEKENEIIKKENRINSLEKENRKKDKIIEQYRSKYGDLIEDFEEVLPPTNEPQDTESNSIEDIHSNAQNEINRQSGKVIERDGLTEEEQADAHREAEKVIKEKLEKDGYDCSNWILDEDTNDSYKQWQSFNQVKNIINPEKEPINMVIKSAKGGYIYLSATDFEFLTSNSNNVLMVWDGKNVHSVTAEDIFNKDSNVNLIFDTEYTPKHYYAALSRVFQYVKRTTFAVKNPSYNAYDTIKSFGMDSKTEGVQELFDDNDL